jgi:hypothetical protein
LCFFDTKNKKEQMLNEDASPRPSPEGEGGRFDQDPKKHRVAETKHRRCGMFIEKDNPGNLLRRDQSLNRKNISSPPQRTKKYPGNESRSSLPLST